MFPDYITAIWSFVPLRRRFRPLQSFTSSEICHLCAKPSSELIFTLPAFARVAINYAEYIYLRELMDRNINTYIIGHYNPSVRIIDLVSHTTYVKCVNFIHKWRDLQFKVDSERQIFWETFHGNFIYYQRKFFLKLVFIDRLSRSRIWYLMELFQNTF